MDDSEVFEPRNGEGASQRSGNAHLSGGSNSSSSSLDWLRRGGPGSPTVAIAFSGGGLRSAAFSSGVLQKLVTDGADITHMSCVSGGGYIGSSFVDWVASTRNAQQGQRKLQSIKDISKEYFNHLSHNYAIYCDWQDGGIFPYRGLRDTAVFLVTVLVAFCLLPLLALMSFVPMALRVESLCGEAMRSAFSSPAKCDATQLDCSNHMFYNNSSILWISLVATIVGGFTLSLAKHLHKSHAFFFAICMWLGLQLVTVGALVLMACMFELSLRELTAEELNMSEHHEIAVYGSVALVVVFVLMWMVVPGSPLHQRVGHAVMLLAGARFVQWITFSVPADTTGEERMCFECVIWTATVIIFFMFILGPLRFTIPFLFNRRCLERLLYDGSKKKVKKGLSKLPSLLAVNLPLARPSISSSAGRAIRRQSFIAKAAMYKVLKFPHGTASTLGSETTKEAVVTTQPSLRSRRHNTRQEEIKATWAQAGGEDMTDGGGQPENAWNSSEEDGGVDETDMALRADGLQVDPQGGMTLGDIARGCEEIEIMSQVVAGKWKLSDSDVSSSQMMVLSSKEVCVLSKADNGAAPSGVHITPDRVRIADAMAISGAALSLHNGSYSETFAAMAFKGFQLLFGVAIGSSVMNTDSPDSVPDQLLILLLTVIIYSVTSACIFCQGMDIGGSWPLVIECCLSAFVSICALLPMNVSSTEDLSRTWVTNAVSKLTRCISLYVHGAFMIREFLNIDSVDLKAPAVFALSDGGHLENLGLLPLLYRRCKRIVLADCGAHAHPKDVANDLLEAMKKARSWLGCSFTSMDGGDVVFDLQEKLIKPGIRGEPQPHCYQCKVVYHTDQDGSSLPEPEEGEIVLLQPRHPKLRGSGTSSGTLRNDPPIAIQAKEVDDLTGCCCSCCHGHCHWLSYALCGRFPALSTVAQGFTREMFDTFQREGERAASAPDAVNVWSPSNCSPATTSAPSS